MHSSLYFEDGIVADKIEDHALKYLRSNYQQVAEVFGGSTECFYDVDLQALTAFIVPLAAPSETNNRPNIN